jgi:hypothetical protein
MVVSMVHATVADLIATLDYVDDDASWLDMDITSSAASDVLTTHSAAPRTSPVQPCGMPHHHQRTAAGWSAGTWICAIAQHERQHRTAVTDNLRSSPRFAAIRATVAAQPGNRTIASDPVFIPFLAGIVPDGRSVYRAMLDGMSLRDVAALMGIRL